MNVVDTSAVVAVLFGEQGSDEIARMLMESANAMSAASRVELGIVIEAKTGPAGTQLLEELMARAEIQVVAVDEELARIAMIGWRRYGKGRHPAGLNFGDTFSYALAQRHGNRLLYAGDDFSKTDIVSIAG